MVGEDGDEDDVQIEIEIEIVASDNGELNSPKTWTATIRKPKDQTSHVRNQPSDQLPDIDQVTWPSKPLGHMRSRLDSRHRTAVQILSPGSFQSNIFQVDDVG